MRSKMIIFLGIAVFFLVLYSTQCIREYGTESMPCIHDEPVEDTTRTYLHLKMKLDGTIMETDTLHIYPRAIFVRFYPWVRDTAKIIQLAKKYQLRLSGKISSVDKQLTAIFCVPKGKRGEYYFTPYGRDNFCNFGADSLVEYSFGIFEYGCIFPAGDILFKFKDGTSQARIDSLFEASGLRLFWARDDLIFGGRLYRAIITPKAKKNVLDLGYELQFLDCVIFAEVELGIALKPVRCE